jgi:hypothetical protein
MNPTERLELSRAAATLAQQIQIFESGERPLPGEMRQFIDGLALRGFPTVSILQRVEVKPAVDVAWKGNVGYIVFVPQLGQNTCMVHRFHETVYFNDTFQVIDSGGGFRDPTQSDMGKARAEWDSLTTCHGWRVYARNAVGAPCA